MGLLYRRSETESRIKYNFSGLVYFITVFFMTLIAGVVFGLFGQHHIAAVCFYLFIAEFVLYFLVMIRANREIAKAMAKTGIEAYGSKLSRKNPMRIVINKK